MPSLGDANPGKGFGGPRYPGTFLLALREALATLGLTPTAWKGATVECADVKGQTQQIGLENMYRRLRREPRERWPELLAELIGCVPPDIANPPGKLAEVADRILVRLGQPFSRKDPDMDVWWSPLVEGHVAANLVIDYPNSMSYVTQKQVADSGQEPEFWYERALQNLSGMSPADCIKVVHEDSGLLQCQAGDAYDSSRALLLDRLLPGHEENGFYVVVPGRDHLLILPISETTVMLSPWLRAIAGKTYQEMPYPISPELFWVRGGAWHHFAIESDGEDLLVKPPPEFAEVIERLGIIAEDIEDDDPPFEDDSPPLSN